MYKIAYFIPYTENGSIGGAANTLLQQAVLMSVQHDVYIVIACEEDGSHNSEYVRRCKLNGMKYVLLPFEVTETDRRINVLQAKETIPRIMEFVEYEKFDVLHSVQLNISVEYVARQCGIPHIMNIYQWFNCFNRKQDIFASYVSCDAYYYLGKWAEWLAADSQCVRVYTNINEKKESGAEGVSNKLTLIAVGGIHVIKNQLEVIKAVEMVSKDTNNVRLLLVGADVGGYAEQCKQYIIEHGLQDIVLIQGFQKDVAKCLDQAQVFICGSRWESFPSSIVEALALGLPVISTRAGGITEILKDGENAYIVDSNDAKSICEGIRKCIHDVKSGVIEQIKENVKQTYLDYFSKEIVAKSLNGMYADAIDKYCKKSNFDFEQLYVRCKNFMNEYRNVQDSYLRTQIWKHAYYFICLQDYIIPQRLFLWGAGNAGILCKQLLNIVYPDIEIIGYIDEKKTGVCEKLPIYRKEEVTFESEQGVMICCIVDREAAQEYLENKGYRLLENIFYFS